ncbi:MAG TPA: hydrogenase maturation protease [Gaiellaceae bacterium]|nr:hydrogenase maturation protease [Gaiellaceae bacterium]
MKVIGVGNRWRRDDAVGLEVAARVRAAAPDGVEVLEREGEPVALLDAFDGADAVVLVDAVSSGAPPGTLHRLDAVASALPGELFRRSTHHLGVPEAVELGRALGRLPSAVVVIGVEGGSWDAGEALSPPVAAAVGAAVDAVLEEVARCTSTR